MKLFIWRAVLVVSLVLAPLLAGNLVSAQTIAQPAPSVCVTIAHPLYYGSTDAPTQGDVSRLQTFLNSQGLFDHASVGIFGPLTLRAVEQFQSAHGIAAVGVVGPLTRAAIQKVSCGTTTPPPATTTPVKIYNVLPTSGAVGTTVSITGFGFTSDNTVHFGYGVIMHLPITSSIAIACTTNPSCHGGINQTIQFVVPSTLDPACRFSTPMCEIASMLTKPGDYNVYVQNTNGTSSAVTFSVTGPTTTSPTSTY